MTGDNIHEEMIDHIMQYPQGVSSRELASTFLKFKNADERLAHVAVQGILQKDRRCRYENGLWHVVIENVGKADRALEEEPWVAVYLTPGQQNRAREVMHVSVWSLFDTPSLLLSQWLIDSQQIPAEERELLVSPQDTAFDSEHRATVSDIWRMLENKTVLFFSSHQQGLWSRTGLKAGESMLDDTMVVSYLCKVAEVPIKRPMTLESVIDRLFSRSALLPAALAQGEAFAESAWELLRRIKEKGIVSRAGLERWDAEQTIEIAWAQKSFTFNDIQNAPASPGVYGFTDKAGDFIYIGKGKNVRKRLLGYFRQTEESPEKLITLRNEAYGLTVHRCGSELESLLYEYRLIKKYAPKLNSQIEVNERKGVYNPVGDSIFLLPHAEDGFGMAVCFRKNQKISLLPFRQDFSENESMVQFLEQFFFAERLESESTDFPEQEIVFRWVNKHRDDVVRIDVSRFAHAQQLFENIKCYWPEVG